MNSYAKKRYADQVEIVPQFAEFGDNTNVWFRLRFYQSARYFQPQQIGSYPAIVPDDLVTRKGEFLLRKHPELDLANYRLLETTFTQSEIDGGGVIQGTELYGYAPQDVGASDYVRGGSFAWTVPSIEYSLSIVTKDVFNITSAGYTYDPENDQLTFPVLSGSQTQFASYSVGDYVKVRANAVGLLYAWVSYGTPIVSKTSSSVTVKNAKVTTQHNTSSDIFSALFDGWSPSGLRMQYAMTLTESRDENFSGFSLIRFFTHNPGGVFPSLPARFRVKQGPVTVDTITDYTTPTTSEYLAMVSDRRLLVPSDPVFDVVKGNIWRAEIPYISATT